MFSDKDVHQLLHSDHALPTLIFCMFCVDQNYGLPLASHYASVQSFGWVGSQLDGNLTSALLLNNAYEPFNVNPPRLGVSISEQVGMHIKKLGGHAHGISK